MLDHCRAIDLVLHKAQAKENALPIYDISARREVTNQHIAQLLIRSLGKKYEDCVEHVTDRPNHDRRYLIEPRKIENELGFKPSIEFEQGIEETVKWYVDHPDWWRGIMENSSTFVFDWSKSA